jgi:FkbM family methyltransferase
MSRLFQAFRKSVQAASSVAYLLGTARGQKVLSGLAEVLPPTIHITTPRGSLRFVGAGRTVAWRAQTLLTKEQDTIAWINGFKPGAVFWDVGANVGIYSVYAALDPTITAYAFEPSAKTFGNLYQNIDANQMGERVLPFCMAMADKSGVDFINMMSSDIGEAGHAFATDIVFKGNARAANHKQACLGATIDDAIGLLGSAPPTYLKIDVDGTEELILMGARKTLSSPELKSLLIEIDSPQSEAAQRCIALIESCGLKRQPPCADLPKTTNVVFSRS